MRGVITGQRAMLCGLALAGALGISCGYTLIDYQSPPKGLRTVSVLTFANESYEPGVELVMADALRREFLRRGALSLLNDPAAADLVLAGSINRIQSQSRTFSSVALALEFEITLHVKVTATRSDGALIPVDGWALVETERYLASADVEATRKNREEALRKLTAVLAVRTHDMLYEVHRP